MTPKRLTLAFVLFVALAGPAPGATGSCGDENPPADPVEHCIQEQTWICYRKTDHENMGRPDALAQQETCLLAVPNRCASNTWTCTPPPTQRESEHCIRELGVERRRYEPTANILATECNLCPDNMP